jgi:FtsP/CotA-like multicopper oxidase with cupredoxin domain
VRKSLIYSFSKRDLMKNMNPKKLFPTLLIAVLVAVAASQIYSVKAATTRDFTLYGSYSQGWGFTASSITSPGPTIVVEQGDTVNLTLINTDGIYANPHRFFVSYTNASSANSTEPQSSDFTTTSNYQFVATNTVGTYTYGCLYHYDMGMKGSFQIVPTGTIPEFPSVALLSLLVAGTTGVALVHRRKRQA